MKTTLETLLQIKIQIEQSQEVAPVRHFGSTAQNAQKLRRRLVLHLKVYFSCISYFVKIFLHKLSSVIKYDSRSPWKIETLRNIRCIFLNLKKQQTNQLITCNQLTNKNHNVCILF